MTKSRELLTHGCLNVTSSASATRSLLTHMNKYGVKDKKQKEKKARIQLYTEEEKELGKVMTGSPAYYNLIYGLYQMFEEININGDRTMEWTELMQFC